MSRSEVRYARSGEINIAYQVTGDGPFDLVLVPGFISHLELDWAEPRHARFLDRLGAFARLIRFDKRGTGLSDRPSVLGGIETRMDDVRAVMDAVGCARAALVAYWEGGPMAALFAATYPERTSALALYGTFCPPNPLRRLSVAPHAGRDDSWCRPDRGGLGDGADDSAGRLFARRRCGAAALVDRA